MKQQTQTFNDGVVNVYSIGNISEPGNRPKEGLTLKVDPLRYEERTVGMGRFWTAMQAQVRVERILRVPRLDSISSQDVAVPNDGEQYKIVQIQFPKDVVPQCMDLSLERVDSNYEIK